MVTITADTLGDGTGFIDPAMASVQAGQPVTFICEVGIIPQASTNSLATYDIVPGSVSLDVGLAVSVSGITAGSTSLYGMEDSLVSVGDRAGLFATFPAGYQLVVVGNDPSGALLTSDLLTENGSFTFMIPFASGSTLSIQDPSSSSSIQLTNVTMSVVVPPQLGAPYCATVPNSTGDTSALAVAGSPVAAANDFLMLMHDLPPQVFGMAIASTTQGNFPNPNGFGNICLSGTIGRFNQPSQLRLTDANGFTSFQVDLTAIPQGNGFVSAMSGQTWNVQFWHRDVVGGVQSSNLTNAVSVPFL